MIRNKEVILRNISNDQDTQSLNDFSNLCEPLKNYKRNGCGKKYRMHSPLTLFADACNTDAAQSLSFTTAVNAYLDSKNKDNQIVVSDFFRRWIVMDADLIALSANAPLIQRLLPLSKSLKDLSEQFLLIIENNETANPNILKRLLEKFTNRSPADVKVAVYESLKKLAESAKTKP